MRLAGAVQFCETELGSVTHTSAAPKVEVTAGLTLPDSGFDVTLQYYVVRLLYSPPSSCMHGVVRVRVSITWF